MVRLQLLPCGRRAYRAVSLAAYLRTHRGVQDLMERMQGRPDKRGYVPGWSRDWRDELGKSPRRQVFPREH